MIRKRSLLMRPTMLLASLGGNPSLAAPDFLNCKETLWLRLK